jgi:4-carboxymuconolactone decarboxylase
MSADPERGEEILDAARRARGYSLPLHSVLAREDADVLAAYEEMMNALYLQRRRLDGKTKELIYVAALVALGAAEPHVRAHMERARREGASPEEILETIELLIPAAGVARASVGLETWRRTFRRDDCSPTADD